MINDRGSVKWGTSFMMPEHQKLLQEFYEEQTYVDKPILDEQKVVEINLMLQLAIKDDLPIEIEYFQTRKLYRISGKLLLIDALSGWLILESKKDEYKIVLKDITDVMFI